MKYLYDTNVFIDYFADEEAILQWFTEEFLTINKVIISTIVKIELLCYAGLTAEEETAIKECLEQFETIYINPQIEQFTINIRKQHKIKLPDAIIASTSLAEGATLVTRNTEDFKGIINLNMVNPYL